MDQSKCVEMNQSRRAEMNPPIALTEANPHGPIKMRHTGGRQDDRDGR